MNGEVCILAGGLSSRMGRDKSRVKLGGRTLLAHVRSAAKTSGWPVRVIRKDHVPRCGPMGGILTALQTTRADAVLFLACDMPFVSAELIARFAMRKRLPAVGLFAHEKGCAGFPFLLRATALELVEDQIKSGEFSLQKLAARCQAKFVRAKSPMRELFNVNTPDDLLALKHENLK